MAYVVREQPELSERPLLYFWDASKRFGAEFYHTWRWEVFTSLLISAAAYGITVYDDPQAWKNLMVTVQASGYVLAGFALWHVIRTPFLVHRETIKGRRVSEPWGFGVLGMLALAGLVCGIYYVTHVVVRHVAPQVVMTIPSADPGAQIAEVKILRQQMDDFKRAADACKVSDKSQETSGADGGYADGIFRQKMENGTNMQSNIKYDPRTAKGSDRAVRQVQHGNNAALFSTLRPAGYGNSCSIQGERWRGQHRT